MFSTRGQLFASRRRTRAKVDYLHLAMQTVGDCIEKIFASKHARLMSFVLEAALSEMITKRILIHNCRLPHRTANTALTP